MCQIRYTLDMRFNYHELAAIVARSGKTKTAVAAEIGVHLNTVSNWTRGVATPSPKHLLKVLEVAGWTTEQMADLRLVEFYQPNDDSG